MKQFFFWYWRSCDKKNHANVTNRLIRKGKINYIIFIFSLTNCITWLCIIYSSWNNFTACLLMSVNLFWNVMNTIRCTCSECLTDFLILCKIYSMICSIKNKLGNNKIAPSSIPRIVPITLDRNQARKDLSH